MLLGAENIQTNTKTNIYYTRQLKLILSTPNLIIISFVLTCEWQIKMGRKEFDDETSKNNTNKEDHDEYHDE